MAVRRLLKRLEFLFDLPINLTRYVQVGRSDRPPGSHACHAGGPVSHMMLTGIAVTAAAPGLRQGGGVLQDGHWHPQAARPRAVLQVHPEGERPDHQQPQGCGAAHDRPIGMALTYSGLDARFTLCQMTCRRRCMTLTPRRRRQPSTCSCCSTWARRGRSCRPHCSKPTAPGSTR